MSNIKSVLREHISEIIDDMNEELLQDRIIRFWKRNNSHLTLKQFVDTYWEDKSEFAVDLGVSFGKIFEFYLPCKLQELGYNVIPTFTSKGDMIENDISWEIKTGRGKFIQGATHSPKEKSALNLIQVLWDCHWDKTLDDILADRKFISEINICVFHNIIVDSIGEHSNNNSRTTLQFKNNRYSECLDACVFGSIKQNRVNVGFIKESVDSL
jgi:hypothetical protein